MQVMLTCTVAGAAQPATATITVNPVPVAPTITTQPQSQTVTGGQSVSFSVLASGTAPLSYQWRKDGANIQGATSATYAIASVASSDAGSYDVVVSNSAGAVTSNPAILTVNQTAPQLSHFSGNREFFAPREAIFGGTILEVANIMAGQTTIHSSIDNILGVAFTDATNTKVEVIFNFDTSHWSPGFFEIWLRNPDGQESGRVRYAFLGNFNTLAISTTSAIQLDQGPDFGFGSAIFREFGLVDGSQQKGMFVGGLHYQVSVDDTLGFLAESALRQVGVFGSLVNRYFAEYDPDGPDGALPSQAVTGVASWATSDSAIASPAGAPGEFYAGSRGTATITASHSGLFGTSFLGPDRLYIAPAHVRTSTGSTVQFTACIVNPLCAPGSSHDVTAQSTWSSSEPSIALSTGIPGQFEAQMSGQVMITATHRGVTAVGFLGVDMEPATLFVAGPFFGTSPGLNGASNGKLVMGVAAKGGLVCASQDGDDLLSCFDPTQIDPVTGTTQMLSLSIGDQPHSVAMTSIGGQLVCVVYNREDNALSVVDIPSMNLRGFVFLAGLAKASTVSSAQGGWQLGVFHSGPSADKAVLLAQADKKLVVLDLTASSPQELRRIDLLGIPLRIATNDADGSVIVAFADAFAGLTRFQKINPNTGAVTALSATSSLLCTGFGVSADGTQLFCAMREQFQILSNN